jgi:hypothetical protein
LLAQVGGDATLFGEWRNGKPEAAELVEAEVLDSTAGLLVREGFGYGAELAGVADETDIGLVRVQAAEGHSLVAVKLGGVFRHVSDPPEGSSDCDQQVSWKQV